MVSTAISEMNIICNVSFIVHRPFYKDYTTAIITCQQLFYIN